MNEKAKYTAESEHLELGLKALEIAAARLDTFEKSETDKLRLSAATTEYYMLRIYLVSPSDLELNPVD